MIKLFPEDQKPQRIRSPIVDARPPAAPGPQPQQDSQPDHIPETIPGYILRKVIHRGGQGTVYEATQRDTGRLVAVKIMHDRAVERQYEAFRFKREIDILTQLRHPGIVVLYDGGIAQGRPYLVMELIRGRPIDRFIRDRKLSIQDCLRLFLALCEAVGEAHVRGVVHRDLKPANILVDDAGLPHVLDFGLAKLLELEPGSRLPKLTVTGQFVGSLVWAAPEQASGTVADVDIRTDVHALGLILFDGLTGRHAFDLNGPMPESIDRIICSEPRRPSTIRPGINDELDTVVLKCLQKDRNRRYQSAKDLAADLRRYLGGEAIEAKRDSTWYVLRKAARRHRLAVGTLIAGLAAAVLYAATVTAFLSRATTAERLADMQRTEAQRKYELARETLEFVVDEVSTELAAIGPARDSRRRILQGAYSRLQDLLEDRTDDPGLNEDVAGTHLQLGDIALTIGEVETAETHFVAALGMLDGLPGKSARDPEMARLHALAHIRLGDVRREQGNLAVAQALYEDAHVLIEKAVELEGHTRAAMSDVVWSLERRAWIRFALGNRAEAVALYHDKLAVAKQYAEAFPESVDARFALFMAHRHLAETSRISRDYQAAAQWNLKALALGKDLLDRAPDNPVYRRRMAASYFTHARVRIANGEVEPGISDLKSAEALLEKVLADDPEVVETQRDLAIYRLALGRETSRNGDWASASEHYAASVTLWRALAQGGNPAKNVCRQLFRATSGAALASYEIGDLTLAREYSSEAWSVADQMLQEGTVDQEMIRFYASFLRLVGRRVLPDRNAAISTLDAMAAGSLELQPITRLAIARANCSMERWDIGAPEYARVLPEMAGSLREAQRAHYAGELQDCQNMRE